MARRRCSGGWHQLHGLAPRRIAFGGVEERGEGAARVGAEPWEGERLSLPGRWAGRGGHVATWQLTPAVAYAEAFHSPYVS